MGSKISVSIEMVIRKIPMHSAPKLTQISTHLIKFFWSEQHGGGAG